MVGASVGSELRSKGLMAMVLSIIGILHIYRLDLSGDLL